MCGRALDALLRRLVLVRLSSALDGAETAERPSLIDAEIMRVWVPDEKELWKLAR